MASGTDIAGRLPAEHSVEREEKILAAVSAGEIVPIVWDAVPVSHTFADGRQISGEVYVSRHALQLGDADDHFRPTVSHPTAERICDALADVAAAGCAVGCVLPTAKIMDAAFLHATVEVDPCTQSPDAHMSDTDRMLRHSREVDASIAGRPGLTTSEGKGWANTVRLEGRPKQAANYGMYDRGAPYRGVLGTKLWQPGPGITHISGIDNPAFPQGYTDYSQVCERLVRAKMTVNGLGVMDVRDVARDPQLCWLLSTEGPLTLRHPGVPDPDATKRPAPPLAPPQAILTRTLRYGMTGADVAFVQGIVRVAKDGIFGSKTLNALKFWQRTHRDLSGFKLDVDGIVGPKTRRSMLASLAGHKSAPQAPDGFIGHEYDPSMAVFLEARYYMRGVVRDVVHWIVLHSAEAGELPTTAEALQRYAHTMPDGRKASWHWAFDCDSATLSVREEHVAYHALRANRYGVGYEHAGYARQSRAEWLDDYSASMLWISAATAARETCPRWDLPCDNFVDAAGLKKAHEHISRGEPVPNEYRGFTTHHEVTKSLGGSHVDPGAGFPIDTYLQMVKEAA